MSESGGDSAAGLDRLFGDMLRDGWLSGMDVGVDVAMARMDGETGLFNRVHFESLVDRSIGDTRMGRVRRDGDGPAEGNVAVLSVRIDNWGSVTAAVTDQEEASIVARVGEAMKGAFRVDDVMGRLRDDVFGLLLRGCPTDMLQTIADRCLADLAEMRVRTDAGWVVVDARASWAEFDGTGTGISLVADSFKSLN
ncbi:MAG: diguanylate cyclase [Myxococcota bacterium]|nr:diguanylate cyclase [Myxococcota bacterium]